MWPFKRTKRSSPENAAEDPRDEEILRVGWDEFDKEAELEATSNLTTAMLGSLAITGARAGIRNRDADPADEQGRRKTLPDDDAEKT